MITGGSRARACVRAPAFRAHMTGAPLIDLRVSGAAPMGASAGTCTGVRRNGHGGTQE